MSVVEMLTLSYDYGLHWWDCRAVVIDVHHLDPNGGNAAERRFAPVCCLHNKPVMYGQ